MPGAAFFAQHSFGLVRNLLCRSKTFLRWSGDVGFQIDENSGDDGYEEEPVEQVEDDDEPLPWQKSRSEEYARADKNDLEGDGVSPRNESQTNGEEDREPNKSWTRREIAQG